MNGWIFAFAWLAGLAFGFYSFYHFVRVVFL